MTKFKIGDFVYHSEKSIGILTDIPTSDGGGYRVDYCQGKDLKTGPRGGNGPVYRDGYPKEITDPADVLFVKAMQEKFNINKLEKLLDIARNNFYALSKAMQIVRGEPTPTETQRGDEDE